MAAVELVRTAPSRAGKRPISPTRRPTPGAQKPWRSRALSDHRPTIGTTASRLTENVSGLRRAGEVSVRYDEVDALRRHSPAWRLLRADNAPLVLSFLGRVFVEENVRSISATDLAGRLEDELHELNGRLGDGAFPK